MHQIIVSSDIILRSLKLEDAQALLNLVDQNRTFLEKWMCWVPDLKEFADARAFINHNLKLLEDGKGYSFGIWLKGELIGEVGFMTIDDFNQVGNIGYWLAHEHQGKGFITESLKRLVEFGFSTLNLNRQEIRVALNNSRSNLIPGRLGFEKEGKLRKWGKFYDEFVDVYLYSKLKNDE